MSAKEESWYWCPHHSRAEQGAATGCAPGQRLGPYESKDAAEHWRDKVEARNETWEAEDLAWEGDADS